MRAELERRVLQELDRAKAQLRSIDRGIERGEQPHVVPGRVQEFGERPGYIGKPACFGKRSNFAGDQADVQWHIRSMTASGDWVDSGRKVYNPHQRGVCRPVRILYVHYKGGSRAMRRFLIALTLVLLLAVSVGIGVLVAGWPRWHDTLF